ncbi:uncharacterized protein MONBRDRAFT_22630 [Monosiga brevicollis MX1]|uniref:Arabinan endo-1,5-alpha-L-arabinosidase n=1 Tax=Monosiga brevicollis TaxID=81824 RepID=A9UNK9_MONBE|nr:uncharacterized protein MONBRDRAFT_22630 [Monosiga brevicollis MX1]EDQ92714.1 predicted protein [Monosiga brevicollis MX1]|eukprot:XP_001742476.1 hypothetical protein [Monosiga brevicollis MX1]
MAVFWSLPVVAALLFVATSGAAEKTYQNPVIDSNHPDPGVYLEDGLYYAVTTSGDDDNSFPILTSSDLVNWTQRGYIFPSGQQPSWSKLDYWAPEIHRVAPHRYNCYFAARHTDGTLSVGVATATSPLGPYTDLGYPLVHTPGMGNIDVSFFNDTDGRQYLVWKRDGNGASPPVPTPIFVQQITNNGTTLVGEAHQAITNDQAWEGPLVEGPWIILRNGTYYIFYSANGFTSPKYALGVGRADTVTGPYTKATDNPFLASDSSSSPASFRGPGHCSVVGTVGGNWLATWMSVCLPANCPSSPFFVEPRAYGCDFYALGLSRQHLSDWAVVYHAWHEGEVGNSYRPMMLDQLFWNETTGWPYVRNRQASFTPEPYIA